MLPEVRIVHPTPVHTESDGGIMAREERNDDSRDESVSGAMQRGQAAGTAGAPLPRTDAADSGREPGLHAAGGPGDGLRTGGSDHAASGHDPTPVPPQRHHDPDEGNHGIAGERAGGTGP
jgi:hypothetical protein